jgi:hypothetical protein
MKVTKQQKILGGLMLAGIVLVGADQLGLLPGSAEASETTTEATSDYAMPAAPAAQATAPSSATQTSQASVAHRLRQAAQAMPDAPMRDVFALGPTWRGQAPFDPKLDPTGLAAEQFRRSHKLTGVVQGSGRPTAQIDNQIVAIGQSVDGFKLVSVSHRSATFEAGATRIVLNMGKASEPSVAGAQ